MPTSPIRVLLIEVSPLSLQALHKMLKPAANIEVVGDAPNSRQGLAKALQLRPNVICLSTQLADALDLVHDIMSQCPCPILVLHNAGETCRLLLEAGAVDSMTKPTAHWSVNEILAAELVTRIKRMANVPVISRKAREMPIPPRPTIPPITPSISTSSVAATPPPTTPSQPLSAPESSLLGTGIRSRLEARFLSPFNSSGPSSLGPSSLGETPRIVAVGASTGGPHALVSLFAGLPRDYPYPLLCVQHISKGFLRELVEWLDSSCALKVKIASAGEIPHPGFVYFGEEDRHLELDSRGRLWFSAAPPVDGHRPSATALFQSVAKSRGKNSVAVLLTGMGCDGAKGMLSIAEAGGITFAQEEKSCVVFGMPKEAIALGAAQHVLPPPEIARKLIALAAQN